MGSNYEKQNITKIEKTEVDLILEIYNLIINKKIDSFEKLVSFINERKLKISNEQLKCFFDLIKKLYWGKFDKLNCEKYPELWNELVIRNKYYQDFGDLKKYMTISELYVAILDIHGYTKFCQETKNNILMLKRLDQFVNGEVTKCAEKYNVLSNRERGDEIILIAANVYQILAATFDIMNLFSKDMNLKNLSENQPDFYLPAFKISAGIAGGQSKIPLIITENGELSGFLLNMAARLQSRANSLSPDDNKIIVEQYVEYNFRNLSKKNYPILDKVNFFYNGEIEFKGIKMKTFECYSYKPELKYKEEILEPLKMLNEAIKDNQWSTNILFYLFELIIQTAYKMPQFKEELRIRNETIVIDNDWIIKEFSELVRIFSYNYDYDIGIEKLKRNSEILRNSKYFDRLVTEYCCKITEIYEYPYQIYRSLYNSFINENKVKLFSVEENKIIESQKLLKGKYEKIIYELNKREEMKAKRKYFWNRAIESVKDNLEFSIYSGKK